MDKNEKFIQGLDGAFDASVAATTASFTQINDGLGYEMGLYARAVSDVAKEIGELPLDAETLDIATAFKIGKDMLVEYPGIDQFIGARAMEYFTERTNQQSRPRKFGRMHQEFARGAIDMFRADE